MWDERYAAADYAYGTQANDFLVAQAKQIPAGPVLDIGCGEGRNAVFLAEQGFEVTAVDQSAVGLEKAQRLAAERGVTLTTIQSDLARFEIEPDRWSGIVSIWCHLPTVVRRPIHSAIPRGLTTGGVFVMEAYTPEQIGRGTGGPRDADMMMSLERLHAEVVGLDWLVAEESERDVQEGTHHDGVSNVVRCVGRRLA